MSIAIDVECMKNSRQSPTSALTHQDVLVRKALDCEHDAIHVLKQALAMPVKMLCSTAF
jgi:hypothetical protein